MKSHPPPRRREAIRALLSSGFGPLLLVSSLLAQSRVEPAKTTPATSGEAVQLEALVVTGSNIRRIDAETALPVISIDKEDMSLRFDSTMTSVHQPRKKIIQKSRCRLRSHCPSTVFTNGCIVRTKRLAISAR